MSLLKKLKAYRKGKEPEQEQEQEAEQQEAPDQTQVEQQTLERLKAFLYDDRLAEEFLPAFMKLQESGHADQLFELVEAKESELNEVLGSQDSFEQETDPEHKETSDNETEDQEGTESKDYVLEHILSKYGE